MSQDIMPLGDRALLVNFEQVIDPDIHRQVIDLSAKIEGKAIDGISFVQPAYCSLTVGYNPEEIRYQVLKPILMDLLKQPPSDFELPSRLLTLPVCYEEPFSLDLLQLSKVSGLKSNEIIKLHTAETYRTYLLGFLPGFPYLGVLPKPLQFPRKNSPRLNVPERSVGIAGEQTGIYPTQSPGGWNILGSTPLPIFNSEWDNQFLLKPGDRVKFHAISISEYQQMEAEVQNGTFIWESIYG